MAREAADLDRKAQGPLMLCRVVPAASQEGLEMRQEPLRHSKWPMRCALISEDHSGCRMESDQEGARAESGNQSEAAEVFRGDLTVPPEG